MSRLVAVGTPFWKFATMLAEDGTVENSMAVMPEESTTAHNVFAGVTVRDNEDADLVLDLQSTGEMRVRCMGPIAVGDALVQSPGNDYLLAQAYGVAGAPTAGVSRGVVPGNFTYLIPMVLAGGRSSGGGQFPGIPEWADTGWNEGDLVVRSGGIQGAQNPVPGSDIDEGRKVGTWEARRKIRAGSDVNGPSLDSIKWRQVAIFSTEKVVYLMNDPKTGFAKKVTIDVGRDGTEDGYGGWPRMIIEAKTTGDAHDDGARIELRLDLCQHKRIYPQELPVCEIGEGGFPNYGKRVFLCSDFDSDFIE
jgi:hypothetical protein